MIRTAALALAFLPVGLYAQAPTEATSHPTLAEVRTTVALEWGVAPELVRLEVVGGVPEAVDSVSVAPSSSDRWILSLWSGGDLTRRFLRAGVEQAVPLAARPLERGLEVGASDVSYGVELMWGGPRVAVDPVGMVTQRMVAEGEPLVDPTVRAPFVVDGGQEVDALYQGAGVSLVVRGEALGKARTGDVLLVRLASGVRMSARAVAPGRVELIGGER